MTITSATTPVGQSKPCEPLDSCYQLSVFSPEHQTASIYDERLSRLEFNTASPAATPQISTPSVEPVQTTITLDATKPEITPKHIPASLQNQDIKDSLDSNLLFDLINSHRSQLNLPPFQKEDRICQIAEGRAPQLEHEIFGGGGMHSGFRALNLPYWATENMIHQPNEQAALNWWLNSPIHRRAIEGDYTYSCGACQGNNCAQIFTNFTPKSSSV